MKPEIGLYIRDHNLNLYRIIDWAHNGNTHAQRPYKWQVECLKGPNIGKIRWVSESTIVTGGFTVSENKES